MAKVVLFGTGVMARMTHYYLTHDSPDEVVAFTVDGERIADGTLQGLPVVPFEDVAARFGPEDHVMGIPIAFSGVNQVRAAKVAAARAKGYRLISHVSSRALTWPDLRIGENSFIFEDSAIGPFVTVGDDVIIAGASVGHDCVIGDHAFLACHAVVLGGVTIGSYAVVGANSTCRDGITVGARCVVGAGVNLTRSTAEGSVYVSRDAELLSRTSDALGSWLNWPVR